jgi:hypothetical protein
VPSTITTPATAARNCPFALATKAGQAETVERFIVEPEAGVLALVMEFVATAYVGVNTVQGTEVEWLALRR